MKKLILPILFAFMTQALAQTWVQKNDYGGGLRSGTTCFTIGNHAFISTGSRMRDLWKYSPSSDSWAQMPSMPIKGRTYSTGFSIGSKGYVCTGQDSSFILKNDLWEYDTLTNIWTQKAAFPAAARLGACSFSVNGKGYVGFGNIPGNTFFKDLWEYEPSGDSWVQKTSFPGTGRIPGICFVIGNEAYVGIGEDVSWTFQTDFWKYNTVTDQWTQLSNFPGNPRAFSNSFVIGNNGYLLTGYDNSLSYNDFWKYDPITDSWTQLSNFPGNARYESVAFTLNNKGYIATGRTNNNQYFQDVWEYTPNTSGVADIDDSKTVTIYPNPSNGIITLSFAEDVGVYTVNIVSLRGEIVWSEVLSGTNHQLRLNNIDRGIYLLEISGNAGISGTKRLIID